MTYKREVYEASPSVSGSNNGLHEVDYIPEFRHVWITSCEANRASNILSEKSLYLALVTMYFSIWDSVSPKDSLPFCMLLMKYKFFHLGGKKNCCINNVA